MSETRKVAAGITTIWRGRAPNCSSSGSVVGMALISAMGAAAVVNAWAWRFLRWERGEGGPGQGPSDDDGPTLRQEPDGTGLLSITDGNDAALLHLTPALTARAIAAGARIVGQPRDIPGALSAPTEVHIAVTDRCPAACTGCYLDAGPHREGQEPAADHLKHELTELAEQGVLEVAFGGGEGLLRDDLLDLAAHARSVGLVPNLTTSGFGLTSAVAARLAPLMGQVNVSLDGLGRTYVAARGWDGAQRGLGAVRMLVQAGVRVGVNTVLTRPLMADDALDQLGAAVIGAGASEWQWLRFKPTGRGAAAYKDLALDAAMAATLWPRALQLEAQTGLVLRFDCALMPFLVAHQPPLDLVQRLGLRGCPGGQSLWARSADGQWSACSFAAGAPVGDLGDAWAHAPDLQPWRQRSLAPPEPCNSCTYASVCRGGCRVVSAHLAGDALAADPECPRVAAWTAAAGA